MAVKDQMFSQMDAVALERLAGRAPVTIAQNAGVDYDAAEQIFSFSSMGIPLRITYPDYTITPSVSGWHRLAILHYLDLADGCPLTGKDIPFGQMRSGMVRGGGIDRKCEAVISRIENLSEERLSQLCGALGGEKIPSHADIAYRIPFLPRFPMTLKVWLSDEEFPASGRLMVDESADHYFTIEDAVMAAELLLDRLTGNHHM